ncbi:hypothetical protein H0W32_01415 [Patescibacteria group bacterium]|nr:hypothetical protein [Patescibacteria group bacterium]
MKSRQRIRNFSLFQLQMLNKELYQVQNDRGCFDPPVMASRMHAHATQILKAVRKVRLDKISYQVCMAFSWAEALANRFHLNLEDEVWNRFPGVCPYCNQPQCRCGQKRPSKRKPVVVDPRLRPSSCHGYQHMFARIYPQTLPEAASHLAEEVGEVDDAIQNYIGLHRKDLYNHIVLELVDVVTTVFAVATNTNLDLATEMERWFGKGCPGCRRASCDCKPSDRARQY